MSDDELAVVRERADAALRAIADACIRAAQVVSALVADRIKSTAEAEEGPARE